MSKAEVDFETYFLNLPRAELGGLMKEYVAESNHNSWDGFSRHDLTGIRKMLEDVVRYHQNCVDDARELATRISNVNPVP